MHQRVVARLDAASAGNFVKIIFSICSKCLIFKLSVAWSTRGLKTKLMRMTWELLTPVIDIVIWSPTLGCKVCILKTVTNPFNDTWSRLQKVQDWEAFIFSRSRFTYFLDLYNEICSSMYYVFNKKCLFDESRKSWEGMEMKQQQKNFLKYYFGVHLT